MLNFVPDSAATDSLAIGGQAWGLSWESEGPVDDGLLLHVIATYRGKAVHTVHAVPKAVKQYFQPEQMSGFCAAS